MIREEYSIGLWEWEGGRAHAQSADSGLPSSGSATSIREASHTPSERTVAAVAGLTAAASQPDDRPRKL